MRLRLRSIALAALLLLAFAATARADEGAWVWFEYRQPIIGDSATLPRLSLRFWSDTRFSAERGGIGQQFVRIGPIFDVTSWFFLAVHGTIYVDRAANGTAEQEARLEIEPNFVWRLGPLTFSDRNRLEYRFRESVQRVRYRNQIRVNYSPVGAKWIPFVWNEFLVDLRAGYNENRLAAGLGRMLAPNVRLEAAYLLRSRLPGAEWVHDHIGILYLFVGLPPVKR